MARRAPLAAASSGAKALAGTWTGTGSAAGTGASFRIKDNAGTTCHLQGTFGTSGTDMIADNAVIASGQTINITGFTLTDANS